MNEPLALALTLGIHGAGHAAAAILCGAKVGGIRARAGGLSLLCRTDGLSYPRAAIVFAAGPAANLLTAALFAHIYPLSAFSLGAAVFNLFPLPGADGERIIESLLPLALPAGTAYRVTRAVTNAFVALFWLLAVYLALTGRGGGIMLLFAVGMLLSRLGETE